MSDIELCFALFWRLDKTFILILIPIIFVYVFVIVIYAYDFVYLLCYCSTCIHNFKCSLNLSNDFLHFGGM